MVKKKNDQVVSIYLPSSLWQIIKEVARREGLSGSSFIRSTMIRELQKRGVKIEL